MTNEALGQLQLFNPATEAPTPDERIIEELTARDMEVLNYGIQDGSIVAAVERAVRRQNTGYMANINRQTALMVERDGPACLSPEKRHLFGQQFRALHPELFSV